MSGRTNTNSFRWYFSKVWGNSWYSSDRKYSTFLFKTYNLDQLGEWAFRYFVNYSQQNRIFGDSFLVFYDSSILSRRGNKWHIAINVFSASVFTLFLPNKKDLSLRNSRFLKNSLNSNNLKKSFKNVKFGLKGYLNPYSYILDLVLVKNIYKLNQLYTLFFANNSLSLLNLYENRTFFGSTRSINIFLKNSGYLAGRYADNNYKFEFLRFDLNRKGKELALRKKPSGFFKLDFNGPSLHRLSLFEFKRLNNLDLTKQISQLNEFNLNTGSESFSWEPSPLISDWKNNLGLKSSLNRAAISKLLKAEILNKRFWLIERHLAFKSKGFSNPYFNQLRYLKNRDRLFYKKALITQFSLNDYYVSYNHYLINKLKFNQFLESSNAFFKKNYSEDLLWSQEFNFFIDLIGISIKNDYFKLQNSEFNRGNMLGTNLGNDLVAVDSRESFNHLFLSLSRKLGHLEYNKGFTRLDSFSPLNLSEKLYNKKSFLNRPDLDNLVGKYFLDLNFKQDTLVESELISLIKGIEEESTEKIRIKNNSYNYSSIAIMPLLKFFTMFIQNVSVHSSDIIGVKNKLIRFQFIQLFSNLIRKPSWILENKMQKRLGDFNYVDLNGISFNALHWKIITNLSLKYFNKSIFKSNSPLQKFILPNISFSINVLAEPTAKVISTYIIRYLKRGFSFNKIVYTFCKDLRKSYPNIVSIKIEAKGRFTKRRRVKTHFYEEGINFQLNNVNANVDYSTSFIDFKLGTGSVSVWLLKNQNSGILVNI